MDKDAYYFPHFSNARHDRKLKRVRKELGVEGYGIYFMLLETLRDQEFFKYPIDDLDLLADEFGTSEQKVRTVICNYNLFQVDNEQNFFSLKFVEYLQPYLDTKHRNKINGIKGNLIKYNYITREAAESLSDYEIIELNEHRKEFLLLPVAGESGGDKPSDRKERKEKKVNKENNIFTPPTLEEVQNYIGEMGYVVNAKDFYTYYTNLDWKKSDGSYVLNWKNTTMTWNNKELKNNTSRKAADF